MPWSSWLIVILLVLGVFAIVTVAALWAAGAINKHWPD